MNSRPWMELASFHLFHYWLAAIILPGSFLPCHFGPFISSGERLSGPGRIESWNPRATPCPPSKTPSRYRCTFTIQLYVSQYIRLRRYI
ncbi:hypothetical protein QBC33DRAFT_540521 [Phialemonium atrogriseum]|uniref:Uncharacterized protein n=1 Tax=Phialemonium atrogriseum TaxID=1093897 RepID=A0AAJ0BZ18_9PEZI|nr:uncharacterized protein QBC33DRAFT_540521 [Phialemonium atrogriseum]KAK1766876.1 hypothetical protein QBC33DRAFT_540521 [Phialemonium atrogriseum]